MGANAQTSVPLFVANTILTAASQNISAATGVPVFATTVTRDAAFGGSNKVLAEGQLAYIEASDVVQYYTGSAWATLAPSTSITSAIFNETQASGTNGGSSTATTFIKRTLNTTVVNNITGCSLASSVITLAAGSYIVTASAPSYESSFFRIRLQNTSDGTTAALGTSEYELSSTVQTRGIVSGFFTITGNKNFELQHYVLTARANLGFGNPTSIASVSEVYATIQIDKVA
jgi:hypothetical protein